MKKRMICMLLSVLLVLAMTACGSEPSPYEGTWTGVALEYSGYVTVGEENIGMSIQLDSGSKATVTIDGEASSVKWSTENDTLTLKDANDTLTGTITDTCITMEISGATVYFGKEGTDGMNTENYLPENEKKMIGTWTSSAVTDILEEDASAVKDPAGMTIVFNGDLTMTLTLDGQTYGPCSWSNLDTYGAPDDGELKDLVYWEIEDNTLKVYWEGDTWYIYTVELG